MPQKRLLPPIYEDGFGQPVGLTAGRLYNNQTLPLVREVSNQLADIAEGNEPSDDAYTHILTVWGQYIDHDYGLTPQSKSISAFQGNVRCESTCSNLNPCYPIQLPENDELRSRGRQCLPFFRSASICGTDTTGKCSKFSSIINLKKALLNYLLNNIKFSQTSSNGQSLVLSYHIFHSWSQSQNRGLRFPGLKKFLL